MVILYNYNFYDWPSDLSDIEKYLKDQIVLKKQENAFIKDLKVFQNDESMALNASLSKETRFSPQFDRYLVSFTKTKFVSGFSIARTLGRNREEDEFDAQDLAKEVCLFVIIMSFIKLIYTRNIENNCWEISALFHLKILLFSEQVLNLVQLLTMERKFKLNFSKILYSIWW